MIQRRYTHSNPAPHLTTGGDTYLPPCTGRSEPYDALIDHQTGPNAERALRVAKEICATCPVAVMVACFRDNAEEPWVKAMLGHDPHAPTVSRYACGTGRGYRQHIDHHERPCADCRGFQARARARQRKEKAA